MFVDRFMTTAMHYPCNYGYIPQTLSDDGDPVDVLVITPYALTPGVVVTCRPLGVLKMDDEAGGDAKLLAVPIDKVLPIYTPLAEARRHQPDAPEGDPALLRALQGPRSRQVGQGPGLGRPGVGQGARSSPASSRVPAKAKQAPDAAVGTTRIFFAAGRAPTLPSPAALVPTMRRLLAGSPASSPRAACRRRAVAALPRGRHAPSTSVEGIDEYRLANGLQLLLVPDDSKPTTTVNLTYRVGSRHENYGETGMAHLLEHLLFKGTPKHPQGLGRVREARPGAPTARPGSTAPTTPPASRPTRTTSNWYLGWQADAMVNSFIARKDLDTEMTVVRNEMEMGENSPQRILYQRTLALMYDWHNYGKRRIGARSRRRERRHPAAAGLLPPVLPARQRDADRLGPLRRRRRCWRWVAAIVRQAARSRSASCPRCTRSTRCRTASAASRCAASAARR